jgi:hypothetical protein
LPAEAMDVSLTGFEVAEIDLLLADMSHQGKAARPGPNAGRPAWS